jgi:hypothetical protein
MQIKNNILVSCIIILFSLNFVSSISLDIDVNDNFYTGEKILFNYTLLSNVSKTVNYIVYVSCEEAPFPLLKIEEIKLNANIPFENEYVYMSTLYDNFNSQECFARLLVVDNSTMNSNESKQKSFRINTKPKLDFDLLSCGDRECNDIKQIFLKGETAYLSYISNESSLSLNAILETPSGLSSIIEVPSSIKIKEIGTYTLKITANKEGFQTFNKTYYIGSIKEHVIEEKNNEKKTTILVILLIVIIALLFFVIYKVFIKNKE